MESKEIIIAIVIATVLLLALVAFFLFVLVSYRFKRNKHIVEKETLKREFNVALQQSVAEVQETTMKSLGEELHDNIGQLLSSTKMMLGLAEREMKDIPLAFASANETLIKAIAELRSVSKILNKEWLKQFSLIENLENEAKRIKYSGNLQLSISKIEIIPIRSEEQIILFRIVQEALNNVIKHANATNILISTYQNATEFRISVVDDGRGFDLNSKKEGVGLMNMKHRANLLKGTLDVKSSAKGSEINIKLPITAKYEN